MFSFEIAVVVNVVGTRTISLMAPDALLYFIHSNFILVEFSRGVEMAQTVIYRIYIQLIEYIGWTICAFDWNDGWFMLTQRDYRSKFSQLLLYQLYVAGATRHTIYSMQIICNHKNNSQFLGTQEYKRE